MYSRYLDIVIAVAAVGKWVFLIAYASLFPWRRTFQGVALVAYFLGSAMLLTMLWVVLAFGQSYHLSQLLIIAVCTFNAVSVWTLIAAVAAAHHKARLTSIGSPE
jgi:hypothetical protein